MNHTAIPKSLTKRLASSSFWALVGRIASIVTVLMNYRFICSLLPKQEVSVYVICTGLAGLGTLIAGAGLSTALLRRLSSNRQQQSWNDQRRLLVRVLSLSMIGWGIVGCVLLGVTNTLPNLFARPIASVAGYVALWIAGRTLLTITTETLRSLQSFSLSALYGGLQEGPFVNISVTVCLFAFSGSIRTAGSMLLIHATVTGLVAALGLAQAFGLMRKLTINQRPFEPNTESADARSLPEFTTRDLLSESAKVLVSQMAIFGIVEYETLLVGRYCTDIEIGTWGAVRRLISVVSGPLLLINAAIPSFVAELYAKRDLRRLERLLRVSSAIATPPAVAAFVLLAIWGKQVLAFFDPAFAVGYLPLTLMGASNIAFVAAGSAGLTLKMTNRQGWATTSTIVLSILYLCASPLTVSHLGLLGVATLASLMVLARNIVSTLLVKWFLNIWCIPLLDVRAVADFGRLILSKRRAKGAHAK